MATAKTAAPRRMNNQMVQNVLLIWLDSSIDEESEDCQNTLAQLRGAVNDVNIFRNDDECIKFLGTMDNQKACMITSGALGGKIVPRVHQLPQMDSIFIFCRNKEYHEQWSKDWSKVKGVHTKIVPICEALKEAANQCEQNAMPISFVIPDKDPSKKNLDQLNPTFMYSQILKEILLTIKFERKHFEEFIDYCRLAFAKNDAELENIDHFGKTYYEKTPIWWYTCECFLYPMLNCALRLIDVDSIIKIGFFIDDLHQQIERLHKEQYASGQNNESFTVYRGQGLSKEDFEQLTKSKGGLLSFNNFLSTSRRHKVADEFVHRSLKDPDVVGIIFVMLIDPTQSTTPFASINGIGYFKKKEDEVLFSMHTVFRICDIKSMPDNQRLFQVNLKLTSDDDKDLRALTDRIRKGTSPELDGWFRLGSLLIDMGQAKKAQQVLEKLLEDKPDEIQKARIHHLLGITKYDQKEHKEAIISYEKSLQVLEKILSPNDPTLAESYNNMGNAYRAMGEVLKALEAHEKALSIRKRSLPSDHPHLAASYNNIGNLCFDMAEYSKALICYEKNLEISKKKLTPTDPKLAIAYSSVGSVYETIGNYSKAHALYERALDIGKHSLPPDHSSLQRYQRSIDRVKTKL